MDRRLVKTLEGVVITEEDVLGALLVLSMVAKERKMSGTSRYLRTIEDSGVACLMAW